MQHPGFASGEAVVLDPVNGTDSQLGDRLLLETPVDGGWGQNCIATSNY